MSSLRAIDIQLDMHDSSRRNRMVDELDEMEVNDDHLGLEHLQSLAWLSLGQTLGRIRGA